MNRTLTVVQCEEPGRFWWHVRGSNGQVLIVEKVRHGGAS